MGPDRHLATVRERFDMNRLQPSTLVRQFASKITVAAGSSPIVDVACGAGRNALFLAGLGCTVIGIDNDLVRLEALRRASSSGSKPEASRLTVKCIDLIKDPWPFSPRSLGAIVNVHFFLRRLFLDFENSIMPGGYLLFETVPGCGGNYLELPRAGDVRTALVEAFRFEFYKERKVGPLNHNAVSVKLVATRLSG
jgi:SAM-dependent methyltransferase